MQAVQILGRISAMVLQLRYAKSGTDLEYICYCQAEVLFNIFHLPPYTTFELGGLQLDNYVVYRGETLCMLLNSLRLYLLIRVCKNAVLSDLPKQVSASPYHPDRTMS
eukprot:3940826-Rhodomonas_salina.6